MPVFARSRDEMRAIHDGRDMDVGSGWAGWSFPITDFAINGDRSFSRWVNRSPGKRPDGSHYETDGVSFITHGGGSTFSSQIDLFAITHQMKLCDELKAAGLLHPALERDWAAPMKRRLIDALMQGIPLA